MPRNYLLGFVFISFLIWPLPCLAQTALPPVSENAPAASLTLPQALSRVYHDNPLLWKMRAEQRILEARILQASLGPNPEFTFLSEDFAGSAAFSQDRFTQFTLGLVQTLVLGDKVALRTRLAQVQQQLLYWDYRLQLQELGAQVYRAYARLQNLEAEQNLLATLMANAREVDALLNLAVARGKLAPTVLLQSELALKVLETEASRLQLQARLQNQELAALWGTAEADFSVPGGTLEIELAPLASLEQALPRHPRLARWALDRQQRQLALDAARAQAAPDLSLAGGVRYHPPLDWGMVLSLDIPFPFANGNQGNIEEARLRQEMWATERDQEERALQGLLRRAYAQAQGLALQLELLTQQVSLAQAQQQAAIKAFAAGKTGYLDVLTATQNLVQLSRQRVQTQGEHRLALIEVLSYTVEL
ncbi:MAG TPA: TolC family protein, partial [Candidatus Obscuribacterales bacterium]